MSKEEFIESELLKYPLELTAHQRTVLRSVLAQEYYQLKADMREDSNSEAVEGYYETKEY
jgi:hypothetical protein